jgi:enamine deaminase RidA (YjgF/YER057c/UK114 family)
MQQGAMIRRVTGVPLASGLLVGTMVSCSGGPASKEVTRMPRRTADDGRVVEHLNPHGLHQNPAYSQAVVATGSAKTVYIGGQNAVDASGAVIGTGDLGHQTEQILTNIETLLAAAGGRPEHLVKWNVLVVQGQDPQPAFEAFRRWWGSRSNAPVITFAFVSGLFSPEFLIEIDGVAVVPAGTP